MVEVAIAIAVLTVALLGFSQAIVAATNVSRTNREIALATEAGRRAIETMRAADFSEIFARFNGDAADDPPGVVAPGNTIAVLGLQPRPGDPDGIVGQIVFPTAAGVPGQLREDLVDADMGMPRDLNGDGAVDGADHAGDYMLLPVLVRIQWAGAGGQSQVEFKTVIADY